MDHGILYQIQGGPGGGYWKSSLFYRTLSEALPFPPVIRSIPSLRASSNNQKGSQASGKPAQWAEEGKDEKTWVPDDMVELLV